MKKIRCVILVLALLFSLTACKNGGKEEPGTGKTSEAETGTVRTEAVPAETAGRDTQPETEGPEGAGRETTEQKTAGQETTEQETAGRETAGQETTERETTGQETTGQEEAEMKLKIQVGDTIFTATLAKNSSVDALKELMADGPLTLDMSDYAGMEKGADLGVALPQNNIPMDTRAGDIILYQGRTFVIYYAANSWSLTPLGKIDNVDEESLRDALGTGDVTVTLWME